MAEAAPRLVISRAEELLNPNTRRSFLRAMGAGGAALLLPTVFAACNDDNGPVGPPGPAESVTLDLSDDIGILNYAYALEQLEAAFYAAVGNSFNTNGISVNVERSLLADIYHHEVIHRDFLAQALGTARIANLGVDFGDALANRTNVFNAAMEFEDLGVAAYNGAGQYLEDPNNLLLAGKIVSVEARHAAAIRDTIDTTGRLFAGNDVVDANGLDRAMEPSQVLPVAGMFVTTTINVTGP